MPSPQLGENKLLIRPVLKRKTSLGGNVFLSVDALVHTQNTPKISVLSLLISKLT